VAPYRTYGKFAPVVGTATVYARDYTGVWRSADSGATWVRILSQTDALIDKEFPVDCLAVDTVNPQYIYTVIGQNLVRINNANTAGAGGATTTTMLGTGVTVGPIDAKFGKLLAHDRTNGVRLLKFDNPRTSLTYTNVADPFYSSMGGTIRSLHISAGKRVYTAEKGSGVMVGNLTAVL
jgi:hypothetical protein